MLSEQALTNPRVPFSLQDHIFAPDAGSMYGPNHVTYVDPEVRELKAKNLAHYP